MNRFFLMNVMASNEIVGLEKLVSRTPLKNAAYTWKASCTTASPATRTERTEFEVYKPQFLTVEFFAGFFAGLVGKVRASVAKNKKKSSACYLCQKKICVFPKVHKLTVVEEVLHQRHHNSRLTCRHFGADIFHFFKHFWNEGWILRAHTIQL